MSSKYRCTGCKGYFPKPAIAINAGKFHSIDCATDYGKDRAAKLKTATAKSQHTKAKKELKDNDRSFQLKKTQTVFNKYIRLRDSDKPCISCYRFHSGQNHAGHYRSVGSCPELRFDPRNCYLQCSPCNNHKSGNVIPYRSNLVDFFGQELVEFLEGPHKPKRYTIANLKTLQRWYNRKIKRIIA